MKQRRVFLILMVCLLTFSNTFHVNAANIRLAKRMNVLFIGNSITYRKMKKEENYYIKYLKGMASDAGIDVATYKVVMDDSNLSYWTKKTKYRKQLRKALQARDYDVIVIQQNTDYAIVKKEITVRQVRKLIEYINNYQSDYDIIWNASWNYKNGAQGLSYSKGQTAINNTYRQLREEFGGQIAWSGNAFKKCRKKYKGIKLWVPDNNHPTYYGAYLSACCTFKAMFEEKTYNNKYNPGLKKSYLKRLQKIADSI